MILFTKYINQKKKEKKEKKSGGGGGGVGLGEGVDIRTDEQSVTNLPFNFFEVGGHNNE